MLDQTQLSVIFTKSWKLWKSDFYSVFDLEWESAGRPGLELSSVFTNIIQ